MKFTNERLVPSCYYNNRGLFFWHLSRYEFAKKYINRTDIVIDVACGTGYGSFELAAFAHKVIGIDIDSETIEFAKRNFKSSNIDYIRGDCLYLTKLLNEKSDVCVSFETIEHLKEEDQNNFLRQIRLTLQSEGVLIISTPNKKLYNPGGNKEHNPFHLHEMELHEFKQILEDHFEDVIIYGQKLFDGFKYKSVSFKAAHFLKSIKNFTFFDKFKQDQIYQLNDFEFTSIDIENCLYFVAIAKRPKLLSRQ